MFFLINVLKKYKKTVYLSFIPLFTFLVLMVILFLAYKATPHENIREFYYNASAATSGWFAAIIAYCGLIYASNTFRDAQKSMRYNVAQNTVDLMTTLSSDEKLQVAKKYLFKRNVSSLVELSEDFRNDLFYVLNKYEFVALGIRRGLWDESLCKDM